MIDRERAQALEGLSVRRRGFTRVRRREFVDTVRDEEDKVDEQPVGWACARRRCDKKHRTMSSLGSTRTQKAPLLRTLDLEIPKQAIRTE